ncbi:hypothetical protein Aperf_G00000058134 [Anoplocephala perfoliata]
MQACFQLDPADRATTDCLLKHKFLENVAHFIPTSCVSPILPSPNSTPGVSVTPSGDTIINSNITMHRRSPALFPYNAGGGGLYPRKSKVVRGSVYHSLGGWSRSDHGGPANNFGITGSPVAGNLQPQTQPHQVAPINVGNRAAGVGGIHPTTLGKTLGSKTVEGGPRQTVGFDL